MSGSALPTSEAGDAPGLAPIPASGGTLPEDNLANDNDYLTANDNEKRAVALPEARAADPAAFHQVGLQLIKEAVRDARKAAAAAEVFRTAIALFPADPSGPWLHNGLGRALVEIAQGEAGGVPSEVLAEAIQEFHKACDGTKVGSAAHLRFQINLITTRWQQAERGGSRDQLQKAIEALRSVADLSEVSPYWPHIQDYIGNAHMTLGEPDKAIPFFEAAIRKWRGDKTDRARLAANLGVANAALRRWNKARYQYQLALSLLSPDDTPVLWARTNDNLGRLALAELQAGAQKIDVLILTAQKSFEAARTVREQRSQAEWSASTLNLAITLFARVANDPGDDASIKVTRESLDLYKQAAPGLSATLIDVLVDNLSTTCLLLWNLSKTQETLYYIVSYKHDMLRLSEDRTFHKKLLSSLNPVIEELANYLRFDPNNFTGVNEKNDLIIRDILSILRGTDTEEWPAIFAAVQARAGNAPSSRQVQTTAEAQGAAHAATYRPKGDRTLPTLPAGVTWPTETYSGSPESKRGGGGIVSYMERVWKDLLAAVEPGVIDLRTIRNIDASAAMGLNNYKRGGKTLPLHIDVATLKEANDRNAALVSPDELRAARRPPPSNTLKLARALESRQRRSRRIDT